MKGHNSNKLSKIELTSFIPITDEYTRSVKISEEIFCNDYH